MFCTNTVVSKFQISLYDNKMRPLYDAIHWYMAEVGARVVAKTGIPSDRHHLGKLILNCLQDDPDFIFQKYSMCCRFDEDGVEEGRCHDELKQVFETNRPKIIFCQNEKAKEIENALQLAGVEAKIVTYNKSDDYTTLAQVLENADDEGVANFKPADFDPEDTVAYLPSTSGTTGIPKTAMLTHKNLNILVPYMWSSCSKFPTPIRMMFVTSPPQWLSAGFHYLFSAILKYTRLQTSSELTPDHFAELVNKYKIVDPETHDETLEPNVPGEIWFRGPNVFKGYYNKPEATKETLTEDGWFKTGDIFYRDESWNLFFVDRYKSLLKYRNYQVSPVEVEEVIMKHPGVMLVGVTGVPDKESGDLVVACIVPKPGCNPTAQEIKDLVKGKFTLQMIKN
ncbi:hypothetical protein HF086_007808 [Spodoptera exigua]|uniref:Luciferase n=1 Tax=Spodoptera exigua TaxID=7107 RepID=A0A922MJV2_SPOEX|nr:hypothetical protein HF086_007808 [Spodoptera exigua]